MHDVVYVENRLCPIILGHMCSLKIFKMSAFIVSHGRGTPQFVILQGGETC